ncbi:hypothetical protein EAE99_005625 [Botrytis elliptica]|nr:hypothetical protein EAE99_005625 [Botrytis elliptica]
MAFSMPSQSYRHSFLTSRFLYDLNDVPKVNSQGKQCSGQCTTVKELRARRYHGVRIARPENRLMADQFSRQNPDRRN